MIGMNYGYWGLGKGTCKGCGRFFDSTTVRGGPMWDETPLWLAYSQVAKAEAEMLPRDFGFICELCFLDALPHGWPADFRPGLDWWRYECDVGYTIMRKRGNSHVYCPEGEVVHDSLGRPELKPDGRVKLHRSYGTAIAPPADPSFLVKAGLARPHIYGEPEALKTTWLATAGWDLVVACSYDTNIYLEDGGIFVGGRNVA